LKPERVAELLYKFSTTLIEKTYNDKSNFKINRKFFEYNYGTQIPKDTDKNQTEQTEDSNQPKTEDSNQPKTEDSNQPKTEDSNKPKTEDSKAKTEKGDEDENEGLATEKNQTTDK
jgi:hypothetical protein